jgi:hypothetical protein
VSLSAKVKRKQDLKESGLKQEKVVSRERSHSESFLTRFRENQTRRKRTTNQD